MIIIPQSLIYYVDSSRNLADASIGSFAEPDANDIVPDIAVAHVHCDWKRQINISNPISQFTCWDALKVWHAGIPILMEVKRLPGRSLEGREFQDALLLLLNDAINNLEHQASYLLANSSHAKQAFVILVGCSGEWWRWREFTREDFQRTPDILEEEEGEECDEEDKGDGLERATREI